MDPRELAKYSNEKIADMIKLARNRMGLTQLELAVRCGVTEKTIRNWEAGSSKLGISKLNSIAEGLGFEEWDEVVFTISNPIGENDLQDNPLINDAVRRQVESLAAEFGTSKQQVINRAVAFLLDQPAPVRAVILKDQAETAGQIKPEQPRRYVAKATSPKYSQGQKPKGIE